MTYPAKLPKQVRCQVLELKRHARAADSGGAADAAAGEADAVDVFDIVISTDTPVSRFFGMETLSHEKSAVDLTYARNGLPLFLEHGKSSAAGYNANSVDPAMRVGIVEDVQIDGGKLRGVARFSRRSLAQEVQRDVEDGLLPWISVGFIPIRAKQTKVAEKATEKNEYLVTRWQPVEVSLVSMPADPNAGVGRSAGDDEFPVEIEVEVETRHTHTEVSHMEPTPGTTLDPTKAPASPGAAEIVRREMEQKFTDRNAEIGKIIEICDANGLSSRASEWATSGKSYGEVCQAILETRRSDPKRTSSSEALAAVPAKDRKRYNYAKAIRSQLQGERLDGVELEVHKELLKNRPDGVQVRGGIFVPMDLRSEEDIEMRTMDSKTANKGADLVFDQPGELIEILRNQAVLARMGARMLTGLSGPITFPKQSGDVTVFWAGENPAAAVAASDLDIDTVLATPKTLIGASAFSRQLLVQTSGQIDAMIRESLGVGTALALDRGGLSGLGSAGQATGIYFAQDVQATDMGGLAPTWPAVAAMIGQVADRNATLGRLGFVTTALLAAKLLTVVKFANTGFPIWEGPIENGSIGGYKAVASTQMLKTLGAGSDHGFIYGNWGDMLVCTWGGTELIVDEVTLKKQGLIEIASFQMGDVVIRHGESFSKATTATTT